MNLENMASDRNKTHIVWFAWNSCTFMETVDWWLPTAKGLGNGNDLIGTGFSLGW